MPIIISPSLLSADFSEMREAVRKIEASGADCIHFDVMDGRFVPVITFGHKMPKDLRPHTGLPFDIHLMVEKPEYHIDHFADAGADHITFHLEATVHAHGLACRIKERNIKAGISIVPSTSVDALKPVLSIIDIVLVMTVNPGFGGQTLIHECLDKIRTLKTLRREHGFNYLISVDGGINEQTAGSVKDAGADILITGSSFFKASDTVGYINKLRRI